MSQISRDVIRLEEAIASKAVLVATDGTVLVPRNERGLLHSISSALRKPQPGLPWYPEFLRYTVADRFGDPTTLVEPDCQINPIQTEPLSQVPEQ